VNKSEKIFNNTLKRAEQSAKRNKIYIKIAFWTFMLISVYSLVCAVWFQSLAFLIFIPVSWLFYELYSRFMKFHQKTVERLKEKHKNYL